MKLYGCTNKRRNMNVEEKVKEIICDLLGVEASEIAENTDLKEDLQADSLDFTEIVMQIEDEFEIEMDEEKMLTIKTFGDLINYINEIK